MKFRHPIKLIWLIRLLILFQFIFSTQILAQTNNIVVVQGKLISKTENFLNESENIFSTTIKLDGHDFKIINIFKNIHEADQQKAFYLNAFKKMKIVYSSDTAFNIKSFYSKQCLNSKFPVLFQGDSIDNYLGYTYKKIVLNGETYYLIHGYFLGCNGSFCSNTGVLLIKMKGLKLMRYYLFGIDQSLYNLSLISFDKSQNMLRLLIPSSSNSNKLRILVRNNDLYLDGHIFKPSGLFCIK